MTPNPEPRHEPIAELSAAIITYNEADRIAACLRSLSPICSEIVVLDSHSTDGTRAVCESFERVRFEESSFLGYAAQKNRALELTRTPWVLCLDADERLTDEAAASIRKLFNGAIPDQLIGARLVRRTFHMGVFVGYGGWTHYRYRLLRKDRVQWRGTAGIPLHELPYPDAKAGGSWNRRNGITLAGDIIHSSKTDLSNQVDTINVYSSIYAVARHRRKIANGNRSFSHRRPRYLLRMLFKPPLKFVEIYVAKLGFLDGYRGFIIAVSSSFATFLRWAKLYELANTEVREASNLPAFLRDDRQKPNGSGGPSAAKN